MSQILGHYDTVSAVVQKRIHAPINQSLPVQRSGETSVKIGISPARTMALGTIGIDIGADTCFQREAGVGDGTGLDITRQRRFTIISAQQTQMTERAQLIVGDARLRVGFG